MGGGLLLVALASFVLSCGSGRDFIPETHEVSEVAKPRDTTGYEYVARRPLGVVGLAEARGMDPKTTARALD